MEFVRRLFIGLCLVTICWAAADQKTALVVEVKGSVTATLNGQTTSLRTLQVVDGANKVTVAAKSRLRLVYLQTGRKETITGPLAFTLSPDGAREPSGAGKIEVVKAQGANTLVPRDENLRRMGGAVHAQAEKSPLELLEQVAMVAVPPPPPPSQGIKPRSSALPANSSPTAGSSVSAGASQVRSSRPILCNVSPAFRWVRSNQKVSWEQGRAPFAVSLTRDDGIIELALASTSAREIVLPELARGYTYTLKVKDDSGAVGSEVFYILSSDEDRQLREDRRILLSGTSDRLESLVAEIAFFEARGLLLDALPLAEEASRRAPKDAGLQAALGRIQLQLGLEKAAENALEKAVELDAGRTSR